MSAIVPAARMRPSFAVFSHVKRESWAYEPKQSGGVSVFLFATPHSPLATSINKGSGTPTNADYHPPHLSMWLALCKARSPVGVPPRLLPKGVIVPEARLRAKGFLRLGRSARSGK